MTRRRSKLPLVMLIYALVFLLLAAAGLQYLTKYLTAYEASRPPVVVERYLAAMTDADVDALSRETVSALNTELMPEEDCRALIRELVYSAAPVRSRGAGDELSYVLRADGVTLGRLRLKDTGNGEYGLPDYAVEPCDFDFSFLCSSRQITVPEDWTVRCNGVVLGPERVVKDQIPFALLAEFYDDDALPLPHMLTYDTGLYLTEPEILVTDPAGQPEEELSEERFTDNCSPEDREALIELADRFVRAYILYSSNVDGNYSGNYFRLAKMIVPGSTLQKRMRYAVAGLGWAGSRGEDLKSITYHHFMDLGGGYYLCDLSYENESRGTRGWVATTNNIKLIMVRGEELLVTAMRSY